LKETEEWKASRIWDRRAFLLSRLERWEEAAAAYLRALERTDKRLRELDGSAWLQWLNARAHLPGNEPARECSQLLPPGPSAATLQPLGRLYYANRPACLLLAGGDQEEYRRFCAAQLALGDGAELIGRSPNLAGSACGVYCCVLAPDAVKDYDALLKRLPNA